MSANETAAALMNTGVRAMQGRDLLTFFNGDRARVRAEMTSAAAGQVCDFEASLRPRERKPLSVRVDLAASSGRSPERTRMDHRGVMAAPRKNPQVEATTASMSQVLWHVGRLDVAGSYSQTDAYTARRV